MESLFILIPLSVVAVVVAVAIFFHMNRAGQFDDDQGPAMSILMDDDRPVVVQTSSTESETDTLDDTGKPVR